MSKAIDMTEATKRLELALRELCRSNDKVSEVAKRHGHKAAELWAWLGQFNRSRRDLAEHVIDGVLAGLANRAPKLRADFGSRHGLRPAIAQVRQEAVITKSVVLAAVPPVAGEVGAWLVKQGMDPAAVVSFRAAVSPAVAAAWLTCNTGNRKPSRAKVKRFAAIMREGKWILNGESVKFSSTGRLLDGQSRLQAIVEAGVPADLEVRGGLPDAVQETMDCGEPRKGTHMLEMMGEQHAKILSPALRLIFKWESGQLGSNGGNVVGKMSILENLAIKPTLGRHPGLRLSVAWAVNLGIRIGRYMPLSEAAFFHYLFGRAARLKRDAFFDGLRTGNAITQPVALLRERILGAQARLPAGVRIRLIVKAWNAHHAGRNLPQLTLAPRESVAAIAGVKREEAAA